MSILNKKAKFNYELLDRFEAGIILTGPEVKSCKLGHVSLQEAYVRLSENQLWLLNATISPYKFADNAKYDPTHSRQLLVHKKEIQFLLRRMESSNLTIVPVSMYTKGRHVKLEIALARGKKQYEKKEAKKRQDIDRETQKILKKY